jgi:hypothetical protein
VDRDAVAEKPTMPAIVAIASSKKIILFIVIFLQSRIGLSNCLSN